MNIGIIGLGLIGGSFAKAIQEKTKHTVYGYDKKAVTDFALSCGAIDALLDTQSAAECDMIIAALYPEDTITEITRLAPYLSRGTIVMDCAGIKEKICTALFPVAEKYGFTFVGGHPMAGIEFSGFENARCELFQNASLILIPASPDEPALSSIEVLAKEIGFGSVTLSTAEKHDQMIAYTSQLAHVVSSAYIQSPTSQEHFGFSAGSFRDMTRVAYLNEEMWCELFFENKKYLADEIDALAKRLNDYSRAVRTENRDALYALLHRGKEMKTASEIQFKSKQ